MVLVLGTLFHQGNDGRSSQSTQIITVACEYLAFLAGVEPD